MALEFIRGNPDAPVGHAIVYFSDSSDPGKTGATYIMVLPISVDVAKYVPPFLSGHLESMGSSDVSRFRIPARSGAGRRRGLHPTNRRDEGR